MKGNSSASQPIRQITLSEWQKAGPATHTFLSGLTLTEPARAQVERWRKQGWLHLLELRTGLSIQAFSFAGTVHVETTDGLGLIIDVQPKLSPSSAATFIRYALGIEVAKQEVSRVPWQSHGLIDLLAWILLEEVDETVRRGLLHDYRPQEAWLSTPRGRVQFGALTRQPLPTRLAVPCRYSARRADVPLNRLALAALNSLTSQVADTQLRMALHSRAASLQSECAARDFDKALWQAAHNSLDRRSFHYEGILHLTRFLLQGKAPGLEEDQETTRQESSSGFLFDMNVIFERFVARLCREWAPTGFNVDAQSATNQAYHYDANPYRWRRPSLRPDIVVRRAGVPVVVLDTKYKDLSGRKPSSADLYQLTLYSMAFGAGTHVSAHLVYPTEREGAQSLAKTSIGFSGFAARETLAQIHIIPLPLEDCARALQKRDSKALRELTSRLLQI